MKALIAAIVSMSLLSPDIDQLVNVGKLAESNATLSVTTDGKKTEIKAFFEKTGDPTLSCTVEKGTTSDFKLGSIVTVKRDGEKATTKWKVNTLYCDGSFVMENQETP